MKRRMILINAAIMMALVCTILFPEDVSAAESSMALKVSSASASAVVLKWKKQKQVKDYQIYRSLRKHTGFKRIAVTSKTTFKNEKLYEQRTYYYKVAAVKEKGRPIVSNLVSKAKVRGTYKAGTVYGPEMTLRQRIQVKNAAAKFVNTKISSNMSTYEKIRTAHDYLVKRCSYAPVYNQNGANCAWGALIYKEAQCSGYSRAFKALCDEMGVKCYYVHASETAINPYHQWNIVKLGKQYYHIDVQCNDSSGFRAIYLASDKTVKKIGLRWKTAEFPRCKRDYME